MKDRLFDLKQRVINSDIWNIGLHGIVEKQIDKLNMSEKSARITKRIILGIETLAIGAVGYACAKGYITPEVHATDTDSSEITPAPIEQFQQEKLVNYGQFLIGEAGIGKISDLTLQISSNPETVDKVKDLAYQIIPEAKDKDLSVNIYDMVGDKGTAPFIIVSVNDNSGNLEFAYVGFSIDENNVQRPPQDGDIQIFYPLRVVEQDDNSNFIGIPDVTAQNLQVPVMFFIDNQGNSYFYPPYTDYVAQESNPSGGMKVSAIVFKSNEVEIPLPEGPISELQATLGENYKLKAEGDYFVIDGIDNLKFNQDGTAELVYGGEDLTVAFQAVSLDGEKLNIGPWQYNKEGEVTMLTAGAPKTVEDAEKFPKLAYLEGHAKEKEIDRTNRLYDQWSIDKTSTYDPLDEFKGIIIDGEEVPLEDIIPTDWMVFDQSEFLDILPVGNAYSFRAARIALGQGWSSLEIYDASGNKTHDLFHVPIIHLNPDSSITTTSALLNQNQFSENMDLFIGDGQKIAIAWIIKVNPIESGVSLSDYKLREFMIYYNNKMFFDNQENSFKELEPQFPQDLSTKVYFDLYRFKLH